MGGAPRRWLDRRRARRRAADAQFECVGIQYPSEMAADEAGRRRYAEIHEVYRYAVQMEIYRCYEGHWHERMLP